MAPVERQTKPLVRDTLREMKPLDARTSAAMARVKTKRTVPEERVASALRGLRISYRRNVSSLPGRPDFANKSKGWAIQVHGCFWHGHDCKRGSVPVNNREAWEAKLTRNKERDIAVEYSLRALGFQVHTVWECETKDSAQLSSTLKTNLG